MSGDELNARDLWDALIEAHSLCSGVRIRYTGEKKKFLSDMMSALDDMLGELEDDFDVEP